MKRLICPQFSEHILAHIDKLLQKKFQQKISWLVIAMVENMIADMD